MITCAPGSTARICRYIRCTMDSYSPSFFRKNLINCLERMSFERGHRRFPDPPDNKIICMYAASPRLKILILSLALYSAFRFYSMLFILCKPHSFIYLPILSKYAMIFREFHMQQIFPLPENHRNIHASLCSISPYRKV